MVWIIGAGYMACEYIKVFKDINYDFLVIGRGSKSVKKINEAYNISAVEGGLENFLRSKPKKANKVIVAVGVEELADTTIQLLNYGIKNILVEKPAGINIEEIETISVLSQEKEARVFVAYNRRFYASVLKAKELIQSDGGVKSFNFEFTEWSHKIEDILKAPAVKEQWFYANSTHVIDLAFYIGGYPKEISSYTLGKNEIDWHPSAAIFSGAGISDKNALFSYHANWLAPGRWSLCVETNRHRYIFEPLEKLKIQDIGSINVYEYNDIDYSLDEKYKPGLFNQVLFYLENNYLNLIDINEHFKNSKIYQIMKG